MTNKDKREASSVHAKSAHGSASSPVRAAALRSTADRAGAGCLGRFANVGRAAWQESATGHRLSHRHRPHRPRAASRDHAAITDIRVRLSLFSAAFRRLHPRSDIPPSSDFGYSRPGFKLQLRATGRCDGIGTGRRQAPGPAQPQHARRVQLRVQLDLA